ncbi:hypothetical protein OG946_24870 [Streptomyces sp. NBC_01808]|uniref:hypothetical protein n=1 Tax=Streptomyces sp. NBC_01808 TaxID=2975947 RepID=UPI002DDAD8AB|nr:hypothetical protein [Streptomyces sp. NBC_01808]WSA40314.1 hypothetical protein OG946_24870 [Streptomyces sp. NBC_01808]
MGKKKDRNKVAHFINQYLESDNISRRDFCENTIFEGKTMHHTALNEWLKEAERGEIAGVDSESVKKKKNSEREKAEREKAERGKSLRDWIDDNPDRPLAEYARHSGIPANTLRDRIRREIQHNEFGLRDALSEKKERLPAAPHTQRRLTYGGKVELKRGFVGQQQRLTMEQYARTTGESPTTVKKVLRDRKVEVPGWSQEEINKAIIERERLYRKAVHETRGGRRPAVAGSSNPAGPSSVEPDNTVAPHIRDHFPVDYGTTTQRHSGWEAPYDPYSQPTQPSSSFAAPGWGSGVAVTQGDTPAGWSNNANTFPPAPPRHLPPGTFGTAPQYSSSQYGLGPAGPSTAPYASHGDWNANGGYTQESFPQHTGGNPWQPQPQPQPPGGDPTMYYAPGTGDYSASSYTPPPRQHPQSPGGPSQRAQHPK